MVLRCAMRDARCAMREAKAKAKAVVIPAKAGIHSASRKDAGSMLPRR